MLLECLNFFLFELVYIYLFIWELNWRLVVFEEVGGIRIEWFGYFEFIKLRVV